MGATGPSHGRVTPSPGRTLPPITLPASASGDRPAGGYRRAVLRRLSALLIAAVLSAFAVLLLTGQYTNEGPVLLSLTPTHGVHAGDLFVLLGWGVGLLAEVGLLRSTGRRH
jgi:hypothetical protein